MLKRYASILLIVFCAFCSLQSCLFLTVTGILPELLAEEFPEENHPQTPINFFNKSGENIYVYGAFFDGDFIMPTEYLIIKMTDGYTRLIATDEVYNLNKIVYTGYEKIYTYQFLIIKKETMDNNSQEDIINNNIYDDLLIFTYDELEEMNYEVIYTGKEEAPQNSNPEEPDV